MDSNDPQNADGDIVYESDTGIWSNSLCSLIEEELQQHGVTYSDLTQQLHNLGITDYSEECLKLKIKRGNFSAALLIQILCILGCERVDIRRFVAAHKGHFNKE